MLEVSISIFVVYDYGMQCAILLLQWKLCISSYIRYWRFSVKSSSTITLFALRDSFFDFTYLAWAFTRYEC